MAWTIKGEYMESCNCDYLCPCIYTNPQGPATRDHCTALLIFRVDEGQADGVDLAGSKFALIFKTGRVMADGDWTYAAVIDPASDAQAAALEAIAGGKAGGVPQHVCDGLVSEHRGVQRAPIAFTVDGLARSVEIPGVLSFAIKGVEPRIAPGEAMHIDHTSHPANRRLALAQASHMRISAFGIAETLEGQGNNGHFAPFAWKG
ncbi:MAG: DUF1326 domain-containing protein [Alphaproteobacteria bacterium]|nr:DUF1326 domain-containing protein [Alphaproteobacteria bacterium]